MIEEQKQPENSVETQENIPVESDENNTDNQNLDNSGEEVTTEAEVIVENESEENSDDSQAENEQIIAALQQDIANLKQQLDRQTEQANGFKAQYARLAADFENFRKRTNKEKESLTEQTKVNVITDLLPVVDNFERARTQIKPNNDGEKAIHNSYQGVYKTLVDSLKRIGVSAMRPEGEQFDPNLHEAMLREPTDEYPEGTVIEQLMRGYMLGEKVLRHAMVKVAVPKEPVITSEEENVAEDDQSNNAET
ncbi:MAG: nucleotide exchange factor GrpE [Xenococcaceae cyanobacterium]